MTNIIQDLKQNTSTEGYFKIPFSKLVYTSGINDLITKCKCWWLVSDLGIEMSHAKSNILRGEEFLICSIKVNEDSTAIITLKEDTNEKPIYTKKLDYTDFPLKEYEFYIIGGVMLLKSEY